MNAITAISAEQRTDGLLRPRGTQTGPTAYTYGHDQRLTRFVRRMRGLLFSSAVALIPVLIVTLSPPRSGGLFVGGYLTGTITAPIVALGTLRAANDVFDSRGLDGALGVLVYLALIFLISTATVVWSFYFAS